MVVMNCEEDNEGSEQSGILHLLTAEGPTENVSLAVAILDHVDDACEMSRLLDRAVEDALDLRSSQVEALKAIGSAPMHAGMLGSQLGLVDGAVGPTLDSLLDRGLVFQDGSGLLHLTEAGLATVDRSDAIRLRSADLASSKMSRSQLRDLVDIDLLSSERQLRRA